MPCLMHLGLHCWFRCCTGALQGRCTYSAHTRPDTYCAFKSIRSVMCLLVAVRALYRSAVRTAPNWFPRGTVFWRGTGAVRTAPIWFPGGTVFWRCTGAVHKRCTYSAHEEISLVFFIFPGEALYVSLYVQRLVQRPRRIFCHFSKRRHFAKILYIYG